MSSIRWGGAGKWIEPFVGSGAVVFNVQPRSALLTDSNKHIIALYHGIQAGRISARTTKEHLEYEGNKLLLEGEEHYYDIRDRFNATANPLDFLFLNRSCFKGMIRFNKKGLFNVPFFRKSNRFRQAYVTKICNKIAWIQEILSGKNWTFRVADWRETISHAGKADFVYIDPPYIGRHTDYYNNWQEPEAGALAQTLQTIPSGFAYSMWLENKYRKNSHVEQWFSNFPIFTVTHFYHVGPTEWLRNAMQEALIVSHDHAVAAHDSAPLLRDFRLFDEEDEDDDLAQLKLYA
jgi:DNA adenine methylase